MFLVRNIVFNFLSFYLRVRTPTTMATEKEKLARWSFLDSLLSQGKFISQEEIMVAYHQNPEIRIEPMSAGETLKRLYLPSLRKDLDKFKDKLTELGKRDLWEEVRSETDRRSLLYRYKVPGFSIIPHLTGGMTDAEYRTLAKFVAKLEGVVNRAAYEELRFAILSRVETDYDKGPLIVDYEDNRRLRGREYRSLFYNAIKDKKVLQVDYETFKGKRMSFEFHPYLLKQYNERWFAFGMRIDNEEPYTSVPLDRLVTSPKVIGDYPEERQADYLGYFKERVGVSADRKEKIKRHIVIRITDKEVWGRITTKPLNGQKELKAFDDKSGYGQISLDVFPNPEFYSKILSLGIGVEIESPAYVRAKMVELIKKISRIYLEKIVI